MNVTLQKHIECKLNVKLGFIDTFTWKKVAGGSINEAFKVSSKHYSFFVKINSKHVFKNGFSEEVFGLQFLKENKVLIPNIIYNGKFKEHIFLVLEWVDSGAKTDLFWENFAKQLAIFHQQKGMLHCLFHCANQDKFPDLWLSP